MRGKHVLVVFSLIITVGMIFFLESQFFLEPVSRFHHGRYMMHGFMGPGLFIGFVLFIYLMLYLFDTQDTHRSDDAVEILRKRYANHDIDKETYIKMKKALEEE